LEREGFTLPPAPADTSDQDSDHDKRDGYQPPSIGERHCRVSGNQDPGKPGNHSTTPQ
jgi:hypothetical protein